MPEKETVLQPTQTKETKEKHMLYLGKRSARRQFTSQHHLFDFRTCVFVEDYTFGVQQVGQST